MTIQELSHTADDWPFVSVLMPIRNEAKFIERSLGAVLNQDYPPGYMEVLIADGMSDDGTRTQIATLSAKYPYIPVIVLDNPGRIVPTGLNLALQRARGDVIVRVDGHTIIARDYVRQCVNALARSGAENVGGRMDAVASTPFGEAVALATSSPFGVGGARFHYANRDEWVDTVYLGAWPRRVFEQIGPFDEELVRNQDDELNYRLREKGGRIFLSNRIRSRYYNRTSLRSLWRQYFQYGLWKVRVMQKHPRQMRMRQFVPPAFVASLMSGALLAPFAALFVILWLVLLALYAAANGVASFLVARRNGWKYLMLLPLVFGVLHVSYGLGFLNGMLRFAGRWGDKSTRASVPGSSTTGSNVAQEAL